VGIFDVLILPLSMIIYAQVLVIASVAARSSCFAGKLHDTILKLFSQLESGSIVVIRNMRLDDAINREFETL